MGRDEKNFGPKLNTTTSTLPDPLSPGPPRPGSGYDVPPDPISRRPCPQLPAEQMHNKKLPHFQHFRDCLWHWNRLKNDLKHILKRLFRGEGNLLKTKLIKQKKTLKKDQKLVFKFDR